MGNLASAVVSNLNCCDNDGNDKSKA
jgi:hypothetical protein